MKKRSTSYSAFLNLRVLFGLFVMLAGVFLALVSFGTFSSVFAQTNRTEFWRSITAVHSSCKEDGITGGYSPYNSTTQQNFSNNTANITNPSHPLMQGVSSLSAFVRDGVTLAAGASSVAAERSSYTDIYSARYQRAETTKRSHSGIG